jgi:hypothetical protein
MLDTSTLLYKLNNDIPLTDGQKSSLYELIASGCRKPNKERLYRIIFHDYLSFYTHYGIYNRVYFEGDTCRYCAGQSYPDEIRTVRKCFLEG